MCHGCGGKGWVETAGGALTHICPICKGTGQVGYTTDTTQIGHWPDSCPACGGNRSAPPGTGCPASAHYGTYCDIANTS